MTLLSVRNAILPLLLLTLIGCASVGRQFPSNEVKQIQIGVTSQDDILQIFASPWRTGLEDGMTTWTYGHYQYKVFGDPNTKDLVVRFDKQGKVVSYTYSATAGLPEKGKTGERP